MRISEKLALMERIGSELQTRFSFAEIDIFLAEFDVETTPISINSKRLYAKNALRGHSDETILQIARELELAQGTSAIADATPPRNWQGTSLFRLFISHISRDKVKATRLKECLAPYGIAGFVAHEDIHPTLEWQEEVMRGLNTMDAMVAIHTAGFSQSTFTQQEVGFALGRGAKIISFEMGEQPTGFISRHQSLPRRSRTAEDIAKEINDLLLADSRTQEKLRATKPAKTDFDDDIPF
ncbi:toll/interleukin-1 receptor domain-containing protein [Rhodoferax sp.]|uniref:toll/interleukin-1 receptor domain-containing protein n=1 Tax=Rhodoferax sp. TaxID=50421 RepID=UPI0027442E51|nr:toll/interleukin-1 receptor domain-containing protein [Rhodoferax sp.]